MQSDPNCEQKHLLTWWWTEGPAGSSTLKAPDVIASRAGASGTVSRRGVALVRRSDLRGTNAMSWPEDPSRIDLLGWFSSFTRGFTELLQLNVGAALFRARMKLAGAAFGTGALPLLDCVDA